MRIPRKTEKNSIAGVAGVAGVDPLSVTGSPGVAYAAKRRGGQAFVSG
jgi:hypothetical protein